MGTRDFHFSAPTPTAVASQCTRRVNVCFFIVSRCWYFFDVALRPFRVRTERRKNVKARSCQEFKPHEQSRLKNFSSHASILYSCGFNSVHYFCGLFLARLALSFFPRLFRFAFLRSSILCLECFSLLTLFCFKAKTCLWRPQCFQNIFYFSSLWIFFHIQRFFMTSEYFQADRHSGAELKSKQAAAAAASEVNENVEI